ncbi:hypothetical protein J0B02_10675 [Enterobacteriaceae bacterium YMB-R22]|uniref:DUF6708 domain-containing protein n=1 Tax=Tenebrionicola larvae TaxID=2815733 RepID=UPI002012433F|nr:DUF6708 domain-containing protein [Tenebrionicola larvae]MBV4413277.1 hypothetical protein [Tenebrionicola larvae]
MRQIKDLHLKFTVDRVLSREELANHRGLYQGSRYPYSERELMDNMQLIRMNSTYLETVDVHYRERGASTLVGMFYFCIFFAFFFSSLIYFGIMRAYWFPALAGLFVLIPVAIVCWFFINSECFKYTHYPIRFNRRRQEVHLFRNNGEATTYSWNDIFFTRVLRKPHGLSSNMWYLCGIIFAEDKVTVRDMFTVSFYGPEEEYVYRFWELVRRYMEDEEGVREVADGVGWFLPIVKRREPFWLGFRMQMIQYGWAAIPMSPYVLLESVGRWVSFRTSKIPQWPEEIEARCEIAPEDPYNFDSSSVDELRWEWSNLLFWRLKKVRSVTGKEWEV